mgnify:CR=1 FL=1|tara:strand:+ start:3669 stop:4937 length:1269 start_codon:yes stop_codon:yes gene_type:complete
MNKILILGGGVAGSSLCHYLSEKNFDITIVEKLKKPGGLARTYKYGGHPYEFGPHIWFWPGGLDSKINKTIHDLTNGELFYIDRKLLSYIEKDNQTYKYPIHFDDIKKMPEKELIYRELEKNRDTQNKLNEDGLPIIGNCTFEEYFQEAIGNSLYSKFMKNYTWKMWNIPGNELQTSMVWADRFNHSYTNKEQGGLKGYDPIKFEEHTLGKGIQFQVYPKNGWSDVWDKMTACANFINSGVKKIVDSNKPYIELDNNEKIYFSDYKYVINTIDLDELWGENKLPYTGRLMIPLLLPELNSALPNGTESIHYSSAEFVTRITEMKTITQHISDDTLILIEIPILSNANESFPINTINFAKENNLFAEKAYPQQSKEAINMHQMYIKKGQHINNLLHCGRHAQFRYWGMPETVNSAYEMSKLLD